MGGIPGISHQQAVRALQRAGFRVLRQGKHIVMTNGKTILVLPRANPINAYTMRDIARSAGLSILQFEALLRGK